MTRTDAAFGAAVRALLGSRGLSLRAAQIKTRIDHTSIHKMGNGVVPNKGLVIDFAVGMGEPVNKWLQLAGYDPLPGEGAEGVQDAAGDAVAAGGRLLGLRHPEPPPEVLEAIAEASTRAAKVQIAIDYLRRPELRLRFGSDGGASTEALIAIVRAYEHLAGVQLLPPEVV